MRVFSFLFAGFMGVAVAAPASAQGNVDRGKALVTQYSASKCAAIPKAVRALPDRCA